MKIKLPKGSVQWRPPSPSDRKGSRGSGGVHCWIGVPRSRRTSHAAAQRSNPLRRSPAVLRRALVGDTRTRWYGRRPGGWPRSPKHLLRTTCCRRPYGEMCLGAAAPFVAPSYLATICVPVDRAYPKSLSCLSTAAALNPTVCRRMVSRRPQRTMEMAGSWAKWIELSCSYESATTTACQYAHALRCPDP